MDFTDRAQASVSAAVQTAKDHNHSQVLPIHLALALLIESGQQSPAPPGSSHPENSTSLFTSCLRKAGADPAKLETLLRTALRKIPTQSPPPDDVTASSALAKILKSADGLKTSQHDSFIAQVCLAFLII